MSEDRTAALAALVADLADEVAALALVVDPLDTADLLRPTPADGWDVRDQLGHLAAFDDHGARAVTDPAGFRAEVAELQARGANPVADAVEAGRTMAPEAVRTWWYDASARMRRAASLLTADQRLPWYGPDMGARSFVTARLMETWAHGQDVRDALGLAPSATARLRHVIDIGVRARPYSYVVRGREVPEVPVRVEAVGPDGSPWAWGPDDAEDRLAGPALDLALLLTQRRHLADLSVEVVGPVATEWAGIAQAYAGPAGPGRAPRS
ncbi:MAG: TIGR03084 family metal-binding protein [Actinomycetes bacterium]